MNITRLMGLEYAYDDYGKNDDLYAIPDFLDHG